MQIIINHLTRMQKPAICTAGWDAKTGRHIRPVLPWEPLTSAMLATHGGPLAIGRLVDLGKAAPVGQAPEVEDHLFDPRRVRSLRTVEPQRFWSLLERTAVTTLREIFGDELRTVGGNCATPEGSGRASLGCFAPRSTPTLYLDPNNRVRIELSDGEFQLRAPVTDIRCYERDHQTPRRRAIEGINRELRKGVRAILTVGLGRPWQKEGDRAPRHWFQVNNIHLQSYPIW